MRIQEAKRIVKVLARGEYHSVGYSINEHTDGEVIVECKVYVHDYDSHSATTFQGAINKLMKEMGLMPDPVEEAQEIDDGDHPDMERLCAEAEYKENREGI